MKKDKTKKGKWAIWKTILVVFSSVILVVGATIGGVYFSGGFNQDETYLRNISVDRSHPLYNADNGQFEVTKDFELQVLADDIKTATSTEVVLSFNNTDTHDKDYSKGTISDGVITVPEKFDIVDGKIPVTLNKNESGDVTGGISYLRVSTPNHIYDDVRIAVDVPVQSIKVKLLDYSDRSKEITNITRGESFVADVEFFPAQSKYCYSDDKNPEVVAATRSARIKSGYFTTATGEDNAGNIEYRYENGEMVFIAGDVLPEMNINHIDGYVFRSADKQDEILNTYQDYRDEILYRTILNYLAADNENARGGEASIEVINVDVTGFNVDQAGLKFEDARANKPYTISVKYDGESDNYLDAHVFTKDGELNSQLRYVVLSFETESGLPVGEELKVIDSETVEIDGVTYYKAISNMVDAKSSYWILNFTGTHTQNIKIKVDLLINKDGEEQIYNSNTENILYLEFQYIPENPVTWENEDDIRIVLKRDSGNKETFEFGQDGHTKGIIPQTNLYQRGIYFAYFKNNVEAEAKAIANSVLGSEGYSHEGLYSGRYMFPLLESRMIVANPGEFELYFATVRTGLNGEIEYDNAGRYQIVNMTTVGINVVVLNALHEDSVIELDSTITGEAGTDYIDGADIDSTNRYYVHTGSNATIKLAFKIDEDSVNVFGQLLSEMTLKLQDEQDNDITRYFDIEAPESLTERDGHYAEFTIRVRRTEIVDNVYLASAVLFDENSNVEWKNFILISAGGVSKYLYVYTPEVQSVELSSEKIDLSQPISVKQELGATGDFKTSIKYKTLSDGEDNFETIEELIQALIITITDQHGNTNYFKNEWIFGTTSNYITINGKYFSFRSTDSQKVEQLVFVTSQLKESATKINFTIEQSQGIVSATYDASTSLDATNFVPADNLSDIQIRKVANQGGTVNVNNLVKLYTSTQTADDNQFKNFNVAFDSLFIRSDLSDNDILWLFGEGRDGMLGMFSNLTFKQNDDGSTPTIDYTSVSSIRAALTSYSIESFTIRYDFASNNTPLKFVISDKTGAVSINFTLNLTKNAGFTDESSDNQELYSAKATNVFRGYIKKGETETPIKDTITKFYGGCKIVKDNIYSTADVNGLGYDIYYAKLTKAGSATNVVGEITSTGEIKFYDSWGDKIIAYNISFNLEFAYLSEQVLPNNNYQLTLTRTYIVNRNLQIKLRENAVYNVLGNDNKNLDNYIELSRIESDGADAISIGNDFAIETPSNIFEIKNASFNASKLSGTLESKTGANAPVVEYGKQQTCKIIFKYQDAEIETVEIPIELGYSINNMAMQLTSSGTRNLTVEHYKGKDYLVGLAKHQYSASEIITAGSVQYSMVVASKYRINGSQFNKTFYSVSDKVNVTFDSPSFKAIQGYGFDEEIYLLVLFQISDTDQAIALFPLLVTNLGTELVHYTNPAYNTYEVACKTPNELLQEGIYETVDAGTDFNIATYYTVDETPVKPGFVLYNSESGELINYSFKVAGLEIVNPGEKAYSQDLIFNKNRFESTSDGFLIKLNHLASNIPEAYVAIIMTATNGTWTQDFYYLLQVKSNVELKAPTYAYDGSKESLSGTTGEIINNGIDLEQPWGEATLHQGEKRFNIARLSDNGASLAHTYEIVSVKIGDVEQTDYSADVKIQFANDKIQITPYTSESIKITIKRIYNGKQFGVDNESTNTKAIVWKNESGDITFGEIYYNFEVNAYNNYWLKYGSGVEADVLNPDNGTWTVGPNAPTTSLSTNVDLMNGYRPNGTVQNSELKYTVYRPTGDGTYTRVTSANNAIANVISELNYNNGTLTLKRASDVVQDTTIRVYFYADDRQIGLLTIIVKASVSVEFNNAKVSQIIYSGDYDISGENGFISTYKYNGTTSITPSQVVVEQKLEKGVAQVVQEGDKIKFYPSTEQKTITLKITVTYSGKEYTFEFNVTVGQDIRHVDKEHSVSTEPTRPLTIDVRNEKVIIAKNTLVLSPDNLIQFYTSGAYGNTASANYTPKYSWSSPSNAITGAQEQNAIQIQTQNINVTQAITVLIEIKLNNGIGCYNTIYVEYIFTLKKNVTIYKHYPNPSGVKEFEDAEYLQSGAIFAYAKTFFIESKSIFQTGNNNRIVINKEATDVNYTLIVRVSSISNAKFTYSGTTVTTITDQKIEILKMEEGKDPTTNSQNIKFEISNSGQTSEVVFEVECNSVIEEYKVIIQDYVLELDINKAGDDDIEKIYIDKIAANNNSYNILTQARLLTFKLKSISENPEIENIISSPYVAVFTNGSDKKCFPIDRNLTTNDIGKQITLDLGKSYAGYTYLGTYVNDENNFTSTQNGDLILKDNPTGWKDNGELFSIEPNLIGRVMLYYRVGDSRVPVAYSYYSSTSGMEFNYKNSESETGSESEFGLDNFEISASEEINTTLTIDNFTYTLNNGQTEATHNFSEKYQYQTDIDVDVREKDGYTTLIRGQQVSLIESNGVYHPSTNSNLVAKDLTSENVNIDLKIVGIDYFDRNLVNYTYGNYITSNLNKGDFEAYSGIEEPYNEDKVYRYISVSPPLEDTKPTDYNITALGARNKGSYVLLYFTYSVTITEGTGKDSKNTIIPKAWPLLYFVEPDWNVHFTDLERNDEDVDTGIQSNMNNPSQINPNNDGKYSFAVAGSTDTTNLVSVKHTTTYTSVERGASAFTYTLIANYTNTNKNQISYNIETNLINKFKAGSGTNLGLGTEGPITALNGWTFDNADNVKTFTWKNSNDNAVLEFNNIDPVKVSEQHYVLQATDDYGYRFEVYFSLLSGQDIPGILESELNIVEEGKFDIGAVYERLQINDIAGGQFDIDPTQTSNFDQSEYRMLNITNLRAYGFSEEPSSSYLESNSGGGYKIADGKEITEGSEKYLTRPDIGDITIQEIKLLIGQTSMEIDVDGNNKLSTNESLKYNSGTGVAVQYSNPSDRFTIPKLPSSVYGTNSVVKDVTMNIKLQYNLNGSIEVFNVAVPTNITRSLQFSPNVNNIVRDGAQFNIDDYVTVYGASSDITYYDDTLKITLAPYGAVSFSVTRVRDGQMLTSAVREFTAKSINYTSTQYVSISSMFNDTMSSGDTISLDIKKSGNDALGVGNYLGYYIQYGNKSWYKTKDGDSTSGGTVPLTNMSGVDTINVVDGRELIENKSRGVSVSKYYIAHYSSNNNSTEYQVAVNYNVIPYYYSLSQNTGDGIKFVKQYLIVEEKDDKEDKTPDIYIIPLASWTDGMELNTARNTNNGLSSEPCDSFGENSAGKLYYSVTTTDGASGAASVDRTTGIITTNSLFNINAQHIVVDIKLKASGLLGDFSTEDNSIDLGKVTFMLVPPDSSAAVANSVVDDKPVYKISGKDTLTTYNIGYSNGVAGVIQKETISLADFEGKDIDILSTVSEVYFPKNMEESSGASDASGYTSFTLNYLGNPKQTFSNLLIKSSDISPINYYEKGTELYQEKMVGANLVIAKANKKLTFKYYFENNVSFYYVKTVSGLPNEIAEYKDGTINQPLYIRFINPDDGLMYYILAKDNSDASQKYYKEAKIINTKSQVYIEMPNEMPKDEENPWTNVQNLFLVMNNRVSDGKAILYSPLGNFGMELSQ